MMKKTIVLCFFSLALVACQDLVVAGSVPAEHMSGHLNMMGDRAVKPFLIAPKIDSLSCNDQGINLRLNRSCEELLVTFLESVEPGGARGDIRFGYTLTIPIFSVFNYFEGSWVISKKRIDMWMGLIKKVGRPVVIHIGSNHFSPDYDIVSEISKDKENLMAYVDGKNPSSSYFKFPVHMFTLSTNKNLSINKYRFSALKALAESIGSLDDEVPNLVHAITLVGETYHLSRDIKTKMGNHYNVDFTDYSELSKEDFRSWLKQKFKTIVGLNKIAQTNFSNWPEVTPPYQDFRKKKIMSAWTHFDSFAAGELPVFGWAVCNDNSTPVVNIYLDDNKVGQAIYGLNRLDVYRNSEKIVDPNVGFRYRLQYKNLDPGKYRFSVSVACSGKKENKIGGGVFTVLSKSGVEAIDVAKLAPPQRKIFALKKDGAVAYLGFPRVGERLFFNPFAEIWQEFRAYQVENYLRSSWEIFTENGFPENKVFVAQMVPDLHGTWNQAQLATHLSFSDKSPYQPALMLYGGLAINRGIDSFVGGQTYGVSQFNPMMFKDESLSIEAIFFHINNGASFIAPYYMSVRDDRVFDGKDPHTNMLIYKNSPKDESRYLYKAIKESVRL